jgi:hypothetical protein
VGRLHEDRRLSSAAAAGLVACLGVLGASLLAAKFFYLFFLLSVVALPIVAAESGPWPRRLLVPLLAGGVLLSGLSVTTSRHDMVQNEKPGPDDYAAMSAYLKSQVPEGMTIVAPWNDFPGLFFYNRENRYVVGLNTNFLLRQDEKRFLAYHMLYSGRVSDPENLVPDFFDGSRVLLVRQRETTGADRRLASQLKANPHLAEVVPSPAAPWHVFFVKERSRPSRGTSTAPATAPPSTAPTAPAPEPAAPAP